MPGLQGNIDKGKKFAAVLLCVAALAHTAPVLAAPDGALGTVSTGYEELSLTIPSLIKLSNMGDLSFGQYSGASSTIAMNNRVCVYTNQSDGKYKVTASGDSDSTGGTGTGFYIHMGSAALPYHVKWNPSSADGGTALTAGTALTGQTGANTASQTCNSGSNANYEVFLTRDEILDVPAGSYSGVLKFIVQAE